MRVGPGRPIIEPDAGDRPWSSDGKGTSMNGRHRIMTGVAAGVGLVLLGSVLAGFARTGTPGASGQDVDPTADIHPSVILEGRVKVNGKAYRGFTSSQLFELPDGKLINAATIHACGATS